MKPNFPLGARLVLAAAVFLPCSGFAGQIRGYELERREYFTQCISNGPAPDSARGHVIAAFVRGSDDAALSGGTLLFRGATETFTNAGGVLVNIDELTNAAPPGAYTFTVTTTAEGTQTRSIALAPSVKKIAPPRVINLEPAQSIDPSQPFELRIAPLKGGGPRDQFRLRVYKSSDKSMVTTMTLSAGQTSIVIPGGTLEPRSTNVAFLDIAHPFSIVAPRNGGAYVVASELRSTRFTLQALNPAGEIRFASNQLLARETDGTIAIPVQRSGGAGEVTVDYHIEGITAQPGVNFTPMAGTLIFAVGVTQQVIAVPVMDDGLATGAVIARAWLTNSTGGATLDRRRWNDFSIIDSATNAPNIRAVVLAKVSFYGQTNDGPALRSESCAPNRFYASVQPSFPGAIVRTHVQLPNRTSREMPEAVLTFLEYNEDFPSRAATDKAFRSGGYIITADTLAEGTQAFAPRMTREPAFPAPRLSNWAAAQAIDASAPFQLSWDPFSGAGSNDVVTLSIRDASGDVVLRAPEIFEPGVMDAGTTGFEIPAGALKPGERYHLNVMFGKVSQLKAMPNGTRVCTLFTHTTGLWIGAQGPGAGNVSMTAVTGTCCDVPAIIVSEPAAAFSEQKFR